MTEARIGWTYDTVREGTRMRAADAGEVEVGSLGLALARSHAGSSVVPNVAGASRRVVLMTGSVETPESRQLTLGDQVLQRPKLRHS